MSSRLQRRLWSKEELAHRASAWAQSRAWTGVTVASLLKWKQEGLMPRPTVRSLGRGHGSISGWEWPAYRRLLRILTYRQRQRRWRYLRLALWLDGYEVDLGQVRADLGDFFGELILTINRDVGTERWGAMDDDPPTRNAIRMIERRFTSPEALEGLVRQLELDPVAEPMLRLGLSALLTPEGQRLAIAFVHQFFATGEGDIPSAVAAFRRTLPSTVAAALDGAENELAAHAGLLAHPDSFDNPLLRGIREGTDRTLLNLREVANEAGRFWRAGLKLAVAILEVRPEVLGSLRLMAPLLARLAATMASRPPTRSPEVRAVVLALALASESIRADEGWRLATGLRVLAQLAEWLTRHREHLREIETLSARDWDQLVAAPDFPNEARPLLQGGAGERLSIGTGSGSGGGSQLMPGESPGPG